MASKVAFHEVVCQETWRLVLNVNHVCKIGNIIGGVLQSRESENVFILFCVFFHFPLLGAYYVIFYSVSLTV
jgi:hypothetical protein